MLLRFARRCSLLLAVVPACTPALHHDQERIFAADAAAQDSPSQLAASQEGTPLHSADKPNVVIIYADDVGYADVSCYGADKIQTPNIDRLAKEGLRFTDGHCTAATCTPSRFSMLTGIHGFRHNVRVLAPNAPMAIKPNMYTLPQMFKQAGYATAVVGKWHLGIGDGETPVDWNGEVKPGPLEVGFDYSFLMPSTNDRVPCVYLENHAVVNLDSSDPLYVGRKAPEGFSGTEYPDGKKNPEAMTYYPSSHGHNNSVINGIGRIGFQWGGKSALWNDETMADVFLDQAKAWLSQQKKDEPFFLYFSSQDIHVPRAPHPRFRGLTELGYRGDAMVQLDWSTGAIMQALEELGLDDNTIVIFTSDNGPVYDDGYVDGTVVRTSTEEVDQGHDGSGPYRGGKYQIYEGGTRVPFIIRWPEQIQPGISGALVNQIDFTASFASLLGLELEANQATDSRNTIDAFLGKDGVGLSLMVEEARGLALRDGSWKFTEGTGRKGQDHLHDLSKNLSERNNLASANPERAAAMKATLQGFRDSELGLRAEATALDQTPKEQPPNIVFIMADELGYYELSHMGHPNIQTPNLDALASEGIRFTNMYAGSPLCAPTRGSLMTGKHSGHTSVRSNGGGTPMRLEEQTIASVLKQAGYVTGGFGKWGCGGRGSSGVPEKHGFDTFVGYYDQVHAHTYYPPYILHNSEELPLQGNYGGTEGETYSHYVIMDAAQDFIRSNKDQPFFAYLPITPPHGLFNIPDEDPAWQLYKDKDWPEPARRYAAMVSMVDRQVGEVRALLKELGVADNTLIVFTGDNGGQDYFRDKDHPRGFHGPNVNPQTGAAFRGQKGKVYEGGLRIPAIAYMPNKVTGGRISDHAAYFPDFMPTFAQLAGVQTPIDSDGISFLPELLGGDEGLLQETHSFMYWELGGQRAVRVPAASVEHLIEPTDKVWKAVRPKKNADWELYQVDVDPTESNNLAADNQGLLQILINIAEAQHEAVVIGDWGDRTLHEKDRAAKKYNPPQETK
ncbi:MAG: sulfatase-like hydrolase/transferase [Planctomycetes bacterium]|nr:sulfatase-like hydrolase/transferase [Planctomycetota bacterium]MCP4860732.1 sulfatase-like hydrolase/transferase [Planctomycetota bacterium]